MSQLDALLDAIGAAPVLPGARCRGRHHLFDEAGRGEDSDTVEQRHTQALGLCHHCPARDRCETWFDSLPQTPPPGRRCRRPNQLCAGARLHRKDRRVTGFRPAEHLVHGLDGPIVLIDGAVCARLNRLLGLDKLRAQVRGQNPRLDQALLAIKLAAVAYTESSAHGTDVAPQPEPAARSTQLLNDTVSTTTASAFLGITDRAIRKAISEKRLPATKVDGRWRVTREDLFNLFEYRNGR